MKRCFLIGLIFLLAAAGFWIAAAVEFNRHPEVVQASLVVLPPPDADFARVLGPAPLEFPRDFGPHPAYQTEWWYYTGNLDSKDGRHFGFQLTFFRRGLAGPARLFERSSPWAAGQIYLAHFALTDVGANRFQSFERIERGAAGLAGAGIDPAYRVWLDDWRVEQAGSDSYRLQARQGEISLDLTLVDRKGLALQGDHGYSQKGPEAGNASYYFSQTRLLTTGQVESDGKRFEVSGVSWMDHEFSTSMLSKGQVGWDWFALQLSNGTEVMVYCLRRADGTTDSFSSGLFIAADSASRPLDLATVKIEMLDKWKSPHSGGVYPAGWRLQVPEAGLDLEIQPWIPDQENHLSFTYWEGAVKLSGSAGGAPVTGNGYVELTGYAGSLAGQF
ncbi:MAG TPA: lipocalin-like domain-containing protein [Anaerolineaceae bacterium]|nr:lipocalin-like domain-containing protein [Anaerolineaceae bacterium]